MTNTSRTVHIRRDPPGCIAAGVAGATLGAGAVVRVSAHRPAIGPAGSTIAVLTALTARNAPSAPTVAVPSQGVPA